MDPITPDISSDMRGILHKERVSLIDALDTDWLDSRVAIFPLSGPLIKKISDDEIASLTLKFQGSDVNH